MDRPLVSMALYAYNQEAFVEEALESLLAQDISDYEIILSDDASEDGTFALMEALAARHGAKRTIKLNRNPHRLGIGGQLNAICRLASSELLVLCGGDDRSRPERARRTYEVWSGSPGTSHSVFSDAAIMDDNGVLTGERLDGRVHARGLIEGVATRYHGVYGAAQAMSLDVWRRFGDFHPRLLLEDNAILLRAELLGGWTHLPEELVDYRIHEKNSCRLPSGDVDFERWLKQCRWQHRESTLVNTQFLSDLFAPEAESAGLDVLDHARHIAAYRLLSHQIDLEHYNGSFRQHEREHFKELLGLAIQALKASLKHRFPGIDRRNARRTVKARSEAAY
jgi:glycosyltransferase involved in cell wall biosynthesis